ncbi:MAG: DNA repair protein RecO [Amylibacter sp.]|nr:DNA repair protein RecO [Amylibacter sp.]
MEWQDTGTIISVRKHGENSTIVDVLTQTHGRHAGLVRGGAGRKLAPILQPGTQVDVEWRARLEDHLGTYNIEPIQSRTTILSNRLALSAMGSVCALVNFSFPERMALPRLYAVTINLFDQMAAGGAWLSDYALWEYTVLEELGYGLDLESCAATGVQQDLIYVSPKSGRAVSRQAGAKWADRMLPLPRFLRAQTATKEAVEVLNALKTTGYFLERRLAPALGNRPLPDARARFLTVLHKASAKPKG